VKQDFDIMPKPKNLARTIDISQDPWRRQKASSLKHKELRRKCQFPTPNTLL
jgi:hypothetical protein